MNLTNQKLNQAIKLIQECIQYEEVDVAPDRPLPKCERNENGVIVIKKSNTLNPKEISEKLDKLKENPPKVKSKNISITLDDVEQKRYDEFIAEHEDCQKYTGAIGVSSVRLIVTGTSIGWLLECECTECSEKKSVTDYSKI